MNYEYTAVVTRVVDGDTYDLTIDLGFHVSVRERIRLRGIDTPEIYHPSCPAEKQHGQQAKAFAESQVLGRQVVLKTYKDRTGKYGRWLGDIILQDGSSLVSLLVINGFKKKDAY